MNKKVLGVLGSLVMAALAAPFGASAGGLPTLPASLSSIGTAPSLAAGTGGAASADGALRLGTPAILNLSTAAPLESLPATAAGVALPGLDSLSVPQQAFAAKTNAIRPIRVPGGGRINIPLPIQLPLPSAVSGS